MNKVVAGQIKRPTPFDYAQGKLWSGATHLRIKFTGDNGAQRNGGQVLRALDLRTE